MSKQYCRVMLGKGSANASDGIKGGFIAAGFLFDLDLTDKFPDEWRAFNKKFRPVWLEQNPGKSKVAAGLACGMLHRICRGLKEGDIVMSPDLNGDYHFGEISGPYYYDPSYELPHKRPVRWFDVTAHRNALSHDLQMSIGSIGTVSTVTKHAEEIEAIIGNRAGPVLVARDETVEDPSVFALEMHLEEFLVANWPQTPLGKTVPGAIIALEQDKRIENALKVAPNIDFYRYEVRFDLVKVAG
ncbi:MAG: DUF91 domain-containing protein [Pseudomonadota bacterium]